MMDIQLDNEIQIFPQTLLCAEKQPHLDAQPCRGSWSEKLDYRNLDAA